MSSPKKRHLIFRILAVIGISIVLLVGAFLFWWTKIYIPRLRHSAEQHWAAIGRPMPEFEKKLGRVEENDSLRALTRDLEPFGVKTFYRVNYGSPNPNTINIPKEITNVINLATRGMDEVSPAAQDFAYLNEHASDLDLLYKSILQRDPATWDFVPDYDIAFNRREPNFLTARNLSQLVYVDALHKLEHGDEKGAEDAVAAGLKMTSNIGEQPNLTCLMIRSSIEGLFAEIIARLPEDPNALRRLTTEVEGKRERWRIAIQEETWSAMRLIDYSGMKPEEFEKIYSRKSLLEKIPSSLSHAFAESQWSFFVMGAAEQVGASEHVEDLGIKEMHEAALSSAPIFARSSSPFFSDIFRGWCRSWIRLNAMFLLREQAELIRAARAQMLSGKSGNLGEPESIVVPGAHWHIKGDASTNSVSLSLSPLPSWINNEVAGEKLFLLPLDGSKSWTFRAPRRKPQEERIATK